MRFTTHTLCVILAIITTSCGTVQSNIPSPYYTLSIDQELQNELPAECKSVDSIYETYHQIIIEKLKTPGVYPLRELKLSPASDDNQTIKGEAKELTVGKNWLKNNANHKGDIIYSLATCAQTDYPEELTWVKSGISEYFRTWCGFRAEDTEATAGGTYKDGGTITADFLLYIERTYNVNIVRALYRSAKEKQFSESLFHKHTKKELTTLWNDYQATLKK